MCGAVKDLLSPRLYRFSHVHDRRREECCGRRLKALYSAPGRRYACGVSRHVPGKAQDALPRWQTATLERRRWEHLRVGLSSRTGRKMESARRSSSRRLRPPDGPPDRRTGSGETPHRTLTKRVVYKLAAYDKTTEALAAAFDVPRAVVAGAKSIAGIMIDDDTQIGDWELTPEQSREIASLIRAPFDADRFDCFLEPYVHREEAVGD